MKNRVLVRLGAWAARWGLAGGVAVGVAMVALAQTATVQNLPAPAPAPPAAAPPAAAPPAVLARPVRFARTATVPLAQGLAELSRQSGVPISYSSSRIGARRRCQLRGGPARPLGQALAEMLGPNALAAGLVGGQLVLWPAAEIPPPGVVRLRPWVAAAAPAAPAALSGRAVSGAAVVPAVAVAPAVGATAATVARVAAATPARPATGVGNGPDRGTETVSNAKKPTASRPFSSSLGPLAAQGVAARAGAPNRRANLAARSKPAVVPSPSLPPSPVANAPGRAAAVPANRRRRGAAGASPQQLAGRKNALPKAFPEAPSEAFPEAPSEALPAVARRGLVPRVELQRRVPGGRKKSPSNAYSPTSQTGAFGPIDPLAGRFVLALVPAGAAPETRPLAALAVAAGPPVPARRPLQRRRGQVSLVPPLGTGGMGNARTVNALSLNVLAGYAAGVRGVEIGGLLNVVRDTVRGGQAAGLLNVVGTDVRGVQLAGLGNVGGGGVRGLQAAGSFNVARDDVRGLQLAGLLNVVGGAALAGAGARPARPTRLRRWLGLPRLLATDPLARLPAAPSGSQPGVLVQLAGLANLTGTDVRGLQAAPLLNVARRVRGGQLGLLNVARTVRGGQIGLVNVCDSLTGVPVGLVNVVRRGGYRRGEVWASESLPLNAVFKLGVPRWYTIFGAAAEPFGSRVAWAAGVGVGTAGRPHGRLTLSLDVMQWTLAGTTDDPDAARIDQRLLVQLRPALAWQIERGGHLQLVVAPTLNLAIAWQNDGQPNWEFGANQWLWVETAGAQSQTRLWPGLQVGLRF